MCQSLINGDYTYFLPQNYNAWRSRETSRRERDEEGSVCSVMLVEWHL